MSGRRVAVGVLVLALFGLPWPSVGQDSDSASLTLDECRRMALENNLDLVSEMKDPLISAAQVDSARAPFDPVITAGGNYTHQNVDQVIDTIDENTAVIGSTTGSQSADLWDANASFEQLLGFGGIYSVGFNIDDTDFSGLDIQRGTNFLTDSLYTQRADGWTLNYSMPLLQGFGKEVNQERILLARGNLDISQEDLRKTAIETVQAVEDAYWNTVGAGAAVRISKIVLARAEDLLELNKKKVEVGTLAPIEITQAEAGVAENVELVIQAENLLENSEDLLLELLAVPMESPLWSQSLGLPDRPSFEPIQVNLDEAITEAMELRPEIESARVGLKNSELSERVAKKRVRHGLDINATVRPIAGSDSQQLVVFPGQAIPGSGSRVDQDTADWRVGLQYRIPLHNREAKSSYAIAQHQKDKSDLVLRSVEQRIRVEVRTAVRNLESGIKRVEAARTNVLLQEKKLEAEQKKFENGMSTSFEVLTFQRDLADAEKREIEARLEYVKAQTELEQSKGTLLESRNLKLEE